MPNLVIVYAYEIAILRRFYHGSEAEAEIFLCRRRQTPASQEGAWSEDRRGGRPAVRRKGRGDGGVLGVHEKEPADT